MTNKKFKHIALACAAGLFMGCSLTSCTDDFEEVNTNTNKVYNVELADVWAGTVQRSMNLFAELNYNRFLNFSRTAILQYSTSPGQDTGDGVFRNFYVNILRDMVSLERKYGSEDSEAYANRLAIIKTWESYCFYMMASMYGPIPMSDAISDGSENKRYYKYDSEQEIYTQILEKLTEAYELFNPQTPYEKDVLEHDPVYGADGTGASDLTKWKKFCNTLRLNVAMHVQNMDADLARRYAKMALAGDLIASNDDNVTLTWGSQESNSSSWYYRRFIYNQTSFEKTTYPACGEYLYIYLRTLDDPRIDAWFYRTNELASTNEKPFLVNDTLTRPHLCYNKDNTAQGYNRCKDYKEHQADGLNKYRRDSIYVQYALLDCHIPVNELNNLPTGWRWATVPGQTYTYSDPLERFNSNYNGSFVKKTLVGETAQMTLLNYADACFLRAEAALVFDGDEAQAREAYEAGIRASMEQYACNGTAYENTPGVAWNTDCLKGYHDRRMLYEATVHGSNGTEGHLEQIYKQRFFSDFFNGLECWNLERRTRVFNFPPFFLSGASSNVEGLNSTYNFWTERLIYPEAEGSKNAVAYHEGIEKLQASSPYVRDVRWGDNVFTSLAFAKKNPQQDNADALWGYREIVPKLEYFEHFWGSTYEEVVENAKTFSGQKLESLALGKISYKWQSTLSTYDTEDMPQPEEDEE